MTITQWTREREQKLAVANRQARETYVNRLYTKGWRDGGRPVGYPGDENGGMFDFLLTAALVGAMALSWWLVG